MSEQCLLLTQSDVIVRRPTCLLLGALRILATVADLVLF